MSCSVILMSNFAGGPSRRVKSEALLFRTDFVERDTFVGYSTSYLEKRSVFCFMSNCSSCFRECGFVSGSHVGQLQSACCDEKFPERLVLDEKNCALDVKSHTNKLPKRDPTVLVSHVFCLRLIFTDWCDTCRHQAKQNHLVVGLRR